MIFFIISYKAGRHLANSWIFTSSQQTSSHWLCIDLFLHLFGAEFTYICNNYTDFIDITVTDFMAKVAASLVTDFSVTDSNPAQVGQFFHLSL